MGVATMASKYTIYDTCRPYHSILSVLKPVLCQIRQLDSFYLQLAQVLRSPDLAIFMSMTMMTEPITLPLAHAHGVIMYSHYIVCKFYTPSSLL